MRLSEWRQKAPTAGSMNAKVVAVLKPLFIDLGAEADPECWVVWGDEPAARYSILAPSTLGLISVAVRPADPEGPRATARLIRWSKLTVSELSVEASAGHRIVAVQVESYVLKGMDDDADLTAQFVSGLIGSMDGRSQQALPIAVVQAMVAGTGGAAAHITAKKPHAAGSGAAAGKSPAKPGTHTPKPAPVAATPTARKSKAAAAPGAAAVAVAKAPGKLALVPVQPGASGAAPAGAPAASPATPRAAPAAKTKRLTPLAAGVAAAQNRGRPGQPGGQPHPQPAPEPDRSEWIGPHPIEPPKPGDPKRPTRPWMP